MDYEVMWNEMRNTYQTRLLKLESEDKRGSTAWVNAKRFVDAMSHFEYKHSEQQKG